jgi:hypothetical protein
MTVEENFTRVRDYLLRFNALEFLTQFSMTYLFTREDQFVRESDEIHQDFRALEFASGLYGTVPLTQSGGRVDGDVLEIYRNFARSYFDSVNRDLLTTAIAAGQERSTSATSAKLHSLHVRGDAYPHQFWYLAEAVYAPHAPWFMNNLGFTIADAIKIAQAVESELNDRYSEAKRRSKDAARSLVQEQEQEWKQAGMTEEQALASAGVQLFFGQSKSLYRLSIADVAVKTGLSDGVCAAFFKRLSQVPPYRNPLFPSTFENPLTAPWDYNTTRERPFFSDDQGFWVFAPHLLKEVLYSTFFFDLMNDRSYKGTFENGRGRVLEALTATFLKRAFPGSAVLLNPSYPNGEEFADVCVLFDNKIIIVQCKSKGLTLGAHTGDDRAALKRDLEKAIGNAAAQGCKGRRFLESDSSPHLLIDGKKTPIDMSQVNEVSLMAITYMPLHMFATRLREVEDDLGLAPHEFPVWALPIVDLDIVTEICNSPAKFLHYMRRRMMLETGEKQIRGDEADLLAFYLDQGLWLKGGEIDEANLIGLAGYSTAIDEFVFHKYERGLDTPTPTVQRPSGFDRIVTDIESLATTKRTDCALSLLDLSWEASQDLVGLIQRSKDRCVSRRETIPSSMGHDDPPWGMSIVAAPATIASEEVFNRAQGFGYLKKYARRMARWTALGWREGSARSIDYAFWLDFPFERDASMDALSAQILDQS